VSWEIGDDEWLVAPAAVPGSGPLDPLDDRVIRSLAGPPVGIEVAFELPPEGLPPPPHSAAFDSNTEAPSYESGSFVADANPEPEPEPEPVGEDDPEPDFHIPVLALGVVADPMPSEDSASAEPESAFVIPTLSAITSAPALDDSVEEVDAVELDEAEVIEEVPVRTGDTVIARAPEPPAPEPETHSQSEAVYDDDDDEAAALVIPELVDRVDSSELEVFHEPADDAYESNYDEAPVDPSSTELAEESAFTIPSLARPEPQPTFVDEEPVAVEEDEEEPVEEDEEPVEAEDTDDLHEVEADAIESLDAADLEELEQPVAVGVAVEAETRPPTPPEAKPQKRRKAWYDDVFGDHFPFLSPQTWAETCHRDAQFIFNQLGGREGMTLLDVGCGDGNHAVELAKLGVYVTGVDNSLSQLLAAAQNKENAELEEGRVEFIHGDMRRLPRDREFDAVICIGTTLGYFEEDQNWLCLQEMHDRLVPGGRLLVHVFNRDFVAPHLPSRSWWQGTRCMVIDEAEMNFFANRLRVHRTIIFDDGRQYEHYMFMRAYTVQDLGKAISQLGMRVIQVSGSRDTVGRFYGSASPDIWIVAEKK
jgi:SAM-dependent methyltransferase